MYATVCRENTIIARVIPPEWGNYGFIFKERSERLGAATSRLYALGLPFPGTQGDQFALSATCSKSETNIG